MIYKCSNLELHDIRAVHTIVYSGKGVSLNQYYSGGHWGKRNAIKNKYKAIFKTLMLEKGLPWMDRYQVVVRYNSRHDPSNVTGLLKIFEDTFKDNWVKDDSKEYCKGVHLIPDALPNNTFEFDILHLK